jgi:uncharacterized membrane protein
LRTLTGARVQRAGNRKSNRGGQFSMKALFLAGRVAFGGFFVYNGINHFLQWRSMAQYAAAKKVPQPKGAVLVSGALLVLPSAFLVQFRL